MDIRNFFSKKTDKGNSGQLKRTTAAPPEEAPVAKKKSTPPPPSANGDHKRTRHENVDDDDDDVIVVESPSKRREIQARSTKSDQPTGRASKDSKAVTALSSSSKKPKTLPSTMNDNQIFLDDSSFDNENDDEDDDFVSKTKSSQKESKVIPSRSRRAAVPPKADSPRRSSPRTTTKMIPPTETTAIPQQQQRHSPPKRPPVSAKARTPGSPPVVVLSPNRALDHFDMHHASPQCLAGHTFCLSGIMPQLSRDDASEMIKILGGRVTTAVSSKTTYLILGDVLEDGRPVEQGSKYIRATAPGSTTIIVTGMNCFYGLLQQYSELKTPTNPNVSAESSNASVDTKKAPSVLPVTSVVSTNGSQTSTLHSTPAAAAPKSNPYASATTSNPYARKSSNPYAKPAAAAAAPVAKPSHHSRDDERKMPAQVVMTPKTNDSTQQQQQQMLWVDKYKPLHSTEILGNQDAVRKLSVWLASWEECFNSSNNKVKSFAAPNGPWKAALLSGPPGIGSKYSFRRVSLTFVCVVWLVTIYLLKCSFYFPLQKLRPPH